jgi:hypothetical protein
MWILIVTAMYAGKGIGMQNVSFQSEKACITARTKLSDHYAKLDLSHSIVCVKSYE